MHGRTFFPCCKHFSISKSIPYFPAGMNWNFDEFSSIYLIGIMIVHFPRSYRPTSNDLTPKGSIVAIPWEVFFVSGNLR